MILRMNEKGMILIGKRIIELIRLRTEKGLDVNGKPFTPYSAKTFAVPAASIPKRARLVLKKDGNISWFRRGGIRYIAVKGGYVSLKKAMFKKAGSSGIVDLTLSGQMLRALKVLKTTNNTVMIGFSDTVALSKAAWLRDDGREFLGLTPDEANDAIIQKASLLNLTIKLD